MINIPNHVDFSRINRQPLRTAVAALDASSLKVFRAALDDRGENGGSGFAGRKLWRAIAVAIRGHESKLIAYLARAQQSQLMGFASSSLRNRDTRAAAGDHQTAAVYSALGNLALAVLDELRADREHNPSTNAEDSTWAGIVSTFGDAPELSTCEPDDTVEPPMPREEWDALMAQLAAAAQGKRNR